MKNGMKATIIRYKSSAELDIQFEDGIIVKNKTYQSFQKGMIGHPSTLHKCKIKDRTGETNIMFNGMKASIINYRSSNDIDVRFEDGSLRIGCAYKEFKSGHIAHSCETREAQANSRLGEKKKMNCGLCATITKYNCYHEIEITFEDGEIVYPIDYGQFSKGMIAHPRYDLDISLQEAGVAFYLKQLGFVKMPRGSLKDMGFGNMELDLYNTELKIAIEIDGHFHKREGALKRDIDKNLKCHNAGIKLYRIRDKELPVLEDGFSFNYTLNGELLYNGLIDCGNIITEIICLNNIQTPVNDFINFKRDLELIKSFYFDNTLSYVRNDRIGKKVFHKGTNQFMTIVDYKDYNHITVQFEDGAISHNKNYGSFQRGEIKHPKQASEEKQFLRLGESKMMNCGSNAKIISYRNAEDIDVEFEDGTIRRKVTYYNFSKGSVKRIEKNAKETR